MGMPTARLTDTISHGGVIIESSTDVIAESLGIARRGDKVLCLIHGIQTIIESSNTVLTNSKGIARVGDKCSCGAVIVSGANTVLTGS